MRSRHRGKREDDPLVPIQGVRVRAAIEWRGLSVNGAAARMKVSQQTLDSIVRGRTKRCYQSLRDKLATLCELPAAWLGGETDLLPGLTPWLPLPELGYQPPLWVDENMRVVRPSGGSDLTQRTTLPPRYQLAAHQLSQQIANAWKRDVAADNGEAKTALSRLAKGRWMERPWDRAMMLVTRLVSGFWWRRLFLMPPGNRMAPENPQRGAEALEADNQFAAHAASALTALLQPWFTGERQLDYKAFVRALEWASRGSGKNPSTGGS